MPLHVTQLPLVSSMAKITIPQVNSQQRLNQ